MKKTKRKIPITKQLHNEFGGKWKNIPFSGMWVCDELDLHAHYVFSGGYDVNGCPMKELDWLIKPLYVYGFKTGPKQFYPI